MPGQAVDRPSSVVAAILTTADDALILQQRDGNRQGAAHLRHKVGFFGGHCLDHEPLIDAVVREIYEELELKLDPAYIESLGDYQKQAQIHGDNNFVRLVRYTKPVDPRLLTVHEGSGMVLVTKENYHTFLFTPFAGHVIDYLFGSKDTLLRFRVSAA